MTIVYIPTIQSNGTVKTNVDESLCQTRTQESTTTVNHISKPQETLAFRGLSLALFQPQKYDPLVRMASPQVKDMKGEGRRTVLS